MSSPPAGLAHKLLQLLEYFHRGSLDVPDGLLDRTCVYRLNGASYDDALGPASAGPLIRLLGRGPAAYRSLAQGLRYAVPDVTIQIEDLQGRERAGLVTALATASGTPRSHSVPVTITIDLAILTNDEGRVVEIGAQVAADVLRMLAAARGA